MTIEEYCILAEKQSLSKDAYDAVKDRSFPEEQIACLGDIVFNHILEPAFRYSIINIYTRLSKNENVLRHIFSNYIVVFYTEDRFTYGLY